MPLPDPPLCRLSLTEEDYYEDDEEDDPDALKDPLYQIDLQVRLACVYCWGIALALTLASLLNLGPCCARIGIAVFNPSDGIQLLF